jgi:Ohr subfamily peroxiredoxin
MHTAANQSGKLLYTAQVHTTVGRERGTSRSSDGRLDVKLLVPGGSGAGTNPEQLLSAGWSACFQSAAALIAQQSWLSLPADLAIDTEVDLNLGSDSYFLRARLNIALPDLDRATARTLVEAAHQTCPAPKRRVTISTLPSTSSETSA